MRRSSPHQPQLQEPDPASVPLAPLKGRGTAWAIDHRFQSTHTEPADDGWGGLDQAAQEEVVIAVALVAYSGKEFGMTIKLPLRGTFASK